MDAKAMPPPSGEPSSHAPPRRHYGGCVGAAKPLYTHAQHPKRTEATEMDTTISWKELGFRYLDTGVFVRADYRSGAWSKPELCSGANLNIHIAATCFHYGQACFEGLKAFRQKSGRVACFRPDANARRMVMSAKRL